MEENDIYFPSLHSQQISACRQVSRAILAGRKFADTFPHDAAQCKQNLSLLQINDQAEGIGSVSTIDSIIIAVYFASMIGLGFWYQRRASKNIESYFLGGNRIHWLALAVTGSVSTFDITGTMWMVTLVYLFGMKSIWNHWMWGFMMAAFFMAFMGKWVRRSRVMTGAEWMITRFGDRARWSHGAAFLRVDGSHHARRIDRICFSGHRKVCRRICSSRV